MNRATRRKLIRTATCCLCSQQMTQHDRTIYTRPGLDTEKPEQGVAHPRCVAADAQQRAARAEAVVNDMKRAAARVQEKISTAQRADELGIWLPS